MSKLLLASFASVLVVVLLLLLAIRLRADASVDSVGSPQLRIYCASSVVQPIRQMIESFNRQHGTRIEIVRTGGSGELAGQIEAEQQSDIEYGADVFVSADAMLLETGREQGTFITRVAIATQRPVIATRIGCSFAPQTIRELISESGLKFGIASQHAAIGKLVRKIAQNEGVLERLEQRTATETENVITLAQALVSGSLDAAVLWDTTVDQINRQSSAPVLRIESTIGKHDSLGDIVVGVTASVNDRFLANQFCQFVAESTESKRAFEAHGYGFIHAATNADD